MIKLQNCIIALAITVSANSQVKTFQNQEVATGAGVFLEAEMTTTDIQLTIQGPSDRWFAIGIGNMMADADAIIYTDGKVGAMHTEGVWDYDLNAQNASGVDKDAQDNLTIISNTVNGGLRTIVVSRALNTGDAVDHIIDFSSANFNFVWAKGNSADYTLAYHGGNRGPASIAWQTLDVTPPTISGAFNPIDNAIDVSLSTDATITFDEDIAFGTGLIEIREMIGGVVYEQFNVATPNALTITGTQLTINPSGNFNPNVSYYITIDAGAIEDLAGNAFAGFSDNATWNFTTIDNTSDTIPPSLEIAPFMPQDNEIGVVTNSNLSVNFTEDVQAGFGVIELRNSTNGTIVETYDVATSGNLSFNGTTVVIDPTLNLLQNTDYYVLIESGWTCNIILDTKLSHAACLLLFISSSNSLIVL